MNNSIRQPVTSCINSIVELFQANPYDFLYEEEIQAVLYSRLKAAISQTIKLRVVRNKDRINKDSILTGIVRAEYPSDKRFDIAIIHPGSERRATKRDDRNDLFWKQNLLGAIELKYCQLGEDLDDKIKKFSRDIKKLKNYKNPETRYSFEFGLALLFIQEDNLNSDFITRKYSKAKKSHKVGHVSGIEGYIITKGAKYKVL